MTFPGASHQRPAERGSALVIALLVTVVLALLGISFLLMAETENRIAQNERHAAQVLFGTQSTIRMVKNWFDSPGSSVAFPALADVDRTQRLILDETDPYDPNDVVAADGVSGSLPYYKQDVDLDGNSIDDLLERPYRGGMLQQFLGTEDGPDLVIDQADATAAAFLRTLEQTILPGYPGENLSFRIARIDVFAPPYVRSGTGWARFGVATVRVVGRLLNTATQRVVAEREIQAVVSEIPYWGAYGPLHSCAALTLTGAPMTVHWGPVTAVGAMQLPALLDDIPQGLPRELVTTPRIDPLLSSIDWSDWVTEVDYQLVEDPWLRFISGAAVTSPVGPNGPHPYPSLWAGWAAGDPAPGPCCDVSHMFQSQPLVGCPVYDYTDWKAVAGARERGVHYFLWDGTQFVEDGTGDSGSLEALTDGREGIFFFDTTDALPPRDDDGDAVSDNLTPAITISSSWNFRGVIYANAVSFRLNGATGVNRTVEAPGDPYLDADLNGTYDLGEPYLNLSYPGWTTATVFDPLIIRDAGSRSPRGDSIDLPVSMLGLLINQGTFEATGTGTVYGSVIAVGGVTQAVADGSQPTPRLIFDASISEGFPPENWGLPRLTFTAWDTQVD